MWGISTIGRISLPYFIPKTVKVGQAVNGESAQNLPRKFGALAQLVARNVRIVEVRGSNPLRSTITKPPRIGGFRFVFLGCIKATRLSAIQADD